MCKNEQLMHTYLYRIANTLLINGGFLTNLGLYSGEMGLVLFFYRYARLTQNEIYSEYSSSLLKKVQNKININTSLDYKQGLSGIGSAMEYLTQNGYLPINSDVILDEIDKKVFFTYHLPDLSIDKIADIGYYALWRLTGSGTQKEMIIKSVMPQIIHLMEKWQINQNIINPTVSFFRDIILKRSLHILCDQSMILKWHQLCCKFNLSNLEETKPYAHLLEDFSNTDSITKDNLNLGFQNGLAGLGLYLISELDCDDSWLSLFPNYIISYKNEFIPV